MGTTRVCAEYSLPETAQRLIRDKFSSEYFHDM
jgi:hypothetical protein